MSMRGGYQIIDLKDVPLYSGFLQDNVENHIHVKGIYYNLYHSNAKMILLSGLNMDNKPHRDYEIIPYEEDNEFKAILKKVWNTDKHMVYTYFLHIANDDDVYITYEELDYDRVDTEFNEDSNVAIANSTVTRKVNALDAEDLTFVKLDGSRKLTGNLDVNNHAIISGALYRCSFNTNVDAKGNAIYGLPLPEGDNYAATKLYVDKFTSGYINPVIASTTSQEDEDNTLKVTIMPNIAFFEVNIFSGRSSASKTFVIEEVQAMKSIYDSMGLSYDSIVKGTGYFTVQGLESGSENKTAINMVAEVSIVISGSSVTITLNAHSADGSSTISSIAVYGGAIALHI